MRSLAVKITDKLSMVSEVPTQARAAVLMASRERPELLLSLIKDDDMASYMVSGKAVYIWTGTHQMSEVIIDWHTRSNDVDVLVHSLGVMTRGKVSNELVDDPVLLIYHKEEKAYRRIVSHRGKWFSSPWYDVCRESESEIIFIGKLDGNNYLEMIPYVKNLSNSKASYPLARIVCHVTGTVLDNVKTVRV